MEEQQPLVLIPWDCESLDHVGLLVDHRVDCGWDADKVAGSWRDAQRAGIKCIYWIVEASNKTEAGVFRYDLNSQTVRRSFLSFSHFLMRYFVELLTRTKAALLRDTCTKLLQTRRNASNELFHPVGHISLDTQFPDADSIGMDIPPNGVIWIKSLYILKSLRSNGLGTVAMDILEQMATCKPLYARTLMLDTVHKDDQLRPDFASAVWGSVPKMSNEEWYARRGYRVVKTVQNFYTNVDKSGKSWDTRAVFMQKDLE
ncbi:hypothetical protein EDB80DRAFT_303023 [Ilyonectria destructans]|nr:hypothetical protein EDB80DRAFT_303023 [Ilyonectria destructans]